MSMLDRIHPSRRLILVTVLIIILLTSSIGYLRLSSQRQQVREKLAEADFIVSKIDIVNSTESGLVVTGKAEIDANFTGISDSIQFESLHMELFNNSDYLTNTTISLTSDDIGSGMDFTVVIPVNDQDPSELTLNIFTNILLGRYFTLDFSASIQYTYYGITASLDFDNQLQFILDQPDLSFVLNLLKLPTPTNSSSTINFSVFNPFSLDLVAGGDIDVIVQNTIVGEIDLGLTSFTTGITQLFLPFDLRTNSSHLLDLYFGQISEPIRLNTDLRVGLGSHTFHILPQLLLQTNGLDLDFQIVDINSLDVIILQGDVYANVNGTLTSNIPMALNLTQLSGIITVGQSDAGTFAWTHPQSQNFVPGSKENVDYISINSTLSQLTLLTTSSITFGFREISVSMYVNGELNQYWIEST